MEEEQNIYAMIPAAVLYDRQLSPYTKLLYGEVNAMCRARGFCVARNAHFAEVLDVTISAVSHMLTNLAQRGYIQTEVVRDPQTKQVIQRRIWVVGLPGLYAPPGYRDTTSREYKLYPVAGTCKEGLTGDREYTPHTPQGGSKSTRVPKILRPTRSAPDWAPEAWAKFWDAYPKKGKTKKQDAMDKWDLLKPDEELIGRILKALDKLKATDEWQRDIGVPHVTTFLNQHRWEDADEITTGPSKPTTPGGGVKLGRR